MSELEYHQVAPAPAPAKVLPKRNRFSVILSTILVLAGAFAIYHYAVGRYHVATRDAYVSGNLVRLTPQINGTVVAIYADETQFVQQGQLLVQLDAQDGEVALAQAEANLGQTVREVSQMFANAQRDAAAVNLQQTQFSRAREDLTRDLSLAAVHGVSQETLQHDQEALRSARASLEQAQATLAATRAAVARTTPATHPRVLAAEAGLRTAWLVLARARVVAPISGFIVRRAVQLGQQVAPATEMLAIVPVDSMWIDANFKETELGSLRIGQPVKVSADMYGSHLAFHGRVLGLSAGTGSALSVLPAQNASGNWIKIVQRLPVRVGLDPEELAHHPLFLGLSTAVDVDIHEQDGVALSRRSAWQADLATSAYTDQSKGADVEINKIVTENLGGAVTPHTRPGER